MGKNQKIRILASAIAVVFLFSVSAYAAISWEESYVPAGSGETISEIAALDNLLFVRTRAGISSDCNIYKSSDLGTSWQSTGIDSTTNSFLYGMDIDQGKLYVACGNGIVVSDNGGASFGWSLSWNYDPCMDVDMQNGYGWAAITSWGSMSRPIRKAPETNWTTRRGDITWGYMSMGFATADPIDPSNIAYVTSNIGPSYRTLDGGEHWLSLSSIVIYATIIDSKSVIYNQNSYSEDHGDTWQPLGMTVRTIIRDEESGLFFAAGTGGGIYVGHPGYWKYYGLPDQTIQSLAICGRRLFAVSTTGRIFRATTVITSNQPPVVTDIPDQTINEGEDFASINLNDCVSDPDNADSEIIWTYSENSQLSAYIAPGNIGNITALDNQWSGSGTITFTATDPSGLSASDTATFTINPVNDAPVVLDIPDQTIAEGAAFATINLDNYVIDIDNNHSEITWTYSGNNVLTVSIDYNRIATITAPNFNWNGTEAITFKATDPGGLYSSDAVTFNITAVNDEPVVTDIPDQTVEEGVTFTTINLDNYVTDSDNASAQMNWTYSGNSQLTVSMVNRITTITAPEGWSGSETIVFKATDPGGLYSSNPAIFTVSSASAALYPVIVDDHDTPLPLVSGGWYYNSVGGDRGKLNEGDLSYSWDGNSAYTATVIHNSGLWTWGGMWYSLIRIDRDNIPLDFQNIFGPYIEPEYQGKVVNLEITVNNAVSPSNNNNLCLKVELKNESGSVVHSELFTNLISQSYPKTFTIALNPPEIHNVEQILWIIDNAELGDSITVGSVRLIAGVPPVSVVPSEEQAFCWSYSWLMRNYNPATGMVNDKSRDGDGDLEAITATAKAAKITYYAYKKGYITLANAQAIITKIADTLINTVPRGPSGINTIWPHFTENGGTTPVPPRYGFSGTEWSSGDTIYAALDIITALQMIGDPQTQIPSLEAFLTGINWADLISPQKYICHGYSYEGTKLGGYWQGFGMETIGVDWAYASATGNMAEMEAPPSDNGSGFIDNASYPVVFSGTDYWHNDWDAYRDDMVNTQIGYYNSLNNYLYGAGLFGLSAAEVPDIASNPATKYLAYGTGGKSSPLDGGGEVVTLHYSGMIADKRLGEAISMWETLRDRNAAFLQDRIIVSPLNNMESMQVDKETGNVLAVNYLKGSWNLALQAEGWAMADPSVKADLDSAIQDNAFLKRGYDLLKTPQANIIRVPQDYSTIQAAINAAVNGDTIYVAAGNYNENITLNKSGIILQGANRASYIIGAYGPGASVISCADITGAETVIKGFSITGNTYSVHCAGTVSSLRIEDNYLEGGIYLDNGASAVVQNNFFWYTWILGAAGNNHLDFIGNTMASPGPNLGGLSVSGTTGLIKNNLFQSRWNGAINMYANSNMTIEGNRLSGVHAWTGTAGITLRDSTAIIRNNFIYNAEVNANPLVGVGVDACNSNVSLYNNVFDWIHGYSASTRGVALKIVDSNLIAKNNIFSNISTGQDAVYFSGNGTQDFSYNDMWAISTTVPMTGIVSGPGNMSKNPLFTGYPYYLGIGSPCINRGDPASQFNDLDGTRNDMGIHGGPYGDQVLLVISTNTVWPSGTYNYDSVTILPGVTLTVNGTASLRGSIRGQGNLIVQGGTFTATTIEASSVAMRNGGSVRTGSTSGGSLTLGY